MTNKNEILINIQEIIKKATTAPLDELSRNINREVADFFHSLSEYNAIDFNIYLDYPLHCPFNVNHEKEKCGFLFLSIPLDIDIPLHKLAEESKLFKGMRYCFYYNVDYFTQTGDYALDYCEIEKTDIQYG